MRILVTLTGSWGTGSFNMAEALVNEYLAAGHEVKIFFPDSMGAQSDPQRCVWKFPIAKENLSIPSFPLMLPDPHPRNSIRNTLKSLSEAELNLYFETFESEISRLIDAFQPDVIECHHIWAFGHVLSQMQIPFNYVAHHSDQLAFQYDTRMQKRLIESTHFTSAIFAISDFVKQEVINLYSVPPEKIYVTPNAYDQTTYFPQTVDRHHLLKMLDLDIPEGATILNFVGKISKTKGIDILMEAYMQIKHDPDIHLLILGAGDEQELHDFYRAANGNGSHIHYLGHQEKETIAQIHNISHMSLVPSRSEGFGLSCLEAMGCQIPVVATRSGGPESFAVGEIIDIEDPTALAEAIVKIKNLPSEKYQALCKKALAKAQTFSWKSVASKHLAVFQEQIAPQRKPA